MMEGVGLGRGKECRNEKMEASWKRGGNTGVRREDGVKCCSNTEPQKREGSELR